MSHHPETIIRIRGHRHEAAKVQALLQLHNIPCTIVRREGKAPNCQYCGQLQDADAFGMVICKGCGFAIVVH